MKYSGAIDDTQHHMMPGLVPVMSYEQNSYVASHFDNLDLRNTMVPLMLLSIPCDSDTNAMVSHDSNTNAICIMCCHSVDANVIT